MSEAASSGLGSGRAHTLPAVPGGRARSAREPRSYSVRGSRVRSARGSRGSALNARAWVRSPTRSVWRPATPRASWEALISTQGPRHETAVRHDDVLPLIGRLLDTSPDDRPEGQDASPVAAGADDISFRGSSVSVTVEDFLSDTSAPSSVPSSARGRYSTIGAAWEIAPAVLTPPPSPGASWLTEPPSIDEPLLLFDEAEPVDAAAAETRWLRAELQSARAASKVDRADLEAMRSGRDALELARGSLSAECRHLEQENSVLRSQLENHHGIMASDWATTLGFQERLRQEEAARERLAVEVQELRQDVAARSEEAAALRLDASKWQVLQGSEAELAEASAADLQDVAAAAMSAVARLHAEMAARGKRAHERLASELELKLCVVCRDREKSVLFAPCNHICVCEVCRGKLRPYRCPICQEPVQMHVARVHL